MTEVTLVEAQSQLGAIIDQLDLGEELLITQMNRPVARLVGMQKRPKRQRRLGSAKGQLRIISEDDEHLVDFAEYMT